MLRKTIWPIREWHTEWYAELFLDYLTLLREVRSRTEPVTLGVSHSSCFCVSLEHLIGAVLVG